MKNHRENTSKTTGGAEKRFKFVEGYVEKKFKGKRTEEAEDDDYVDKEESDESIEDEHFEKATTKPKLKRSASTPPKGKGKRSSVEEDDYDSGKDEEEFVPFTKSAPASGKGSPTPTRKSAAPSSLTPRSTRQRGPRINYAEIERYNKPDYDDDEVLSWLDDAHEVPAKSARSQEESPKPPYTIKIHPPQMPLKDDQQGSPLPLHSLPPKSTRNPTPQPHQPHQPNPPPKRAQQPPAKVPPQQREQIQTASPADSSQSGGSEFDFPKPALPIKIGARPSNRKDDFPMPSPIVQPLKATAGTTQAPLPSLKTDSRPETKTPATQPPKPSPLPAQKVPSTTLPDTGKPAKEEDSESRKSSKEMDIDSASEEEEEDEESLSKSQSESEPLSSEEEEEGGEIEDEEEEEEGEEQPKEQPLQVMKDSSFLPKGKKVEKIIAHRIVSQPDDESEEPEIEYLVKWKEISYLHVEWISAATLLEEKSGKSRMQRFLNKDPLPDPEEPFSPAFTTVERIVSGATYNGQTYYLTKWEGLQYCDVTWEEEKNVNFEDHIEKYKLRKIRPPKSKCLPKPKPLPLEYKPLKKAPLYKSEMELRPYQLDGLNWLIRCWYQRINSILADEMGLGKTVQTVAILHYLDTVEAIRGPFLIVVPLSTLAHWQREFERWTDLNAVVYHGNSISRNMIFEHEWYYESKKGGYDNKGPYKFNVIITTYEMLISEIKLFRSIEWQYCVIDEAHRLKNKASKLTTEFSKLKCKHLTLLTGTPIQNNVEELWTLLHILDKEQFEKYEDFEKNYGDMKNPAQVQKLQEILKPFLLRRMKEDVEKSLAPKEETIIEVELTTLQKKYYRSILEGNFDHLAKSGKVSSLPSLMNVVMQLRKCCNHPFLLRGVEDVELGGKTNQEEVNQLLISASGKLVLIDKLLPKLMADEHKVLIFSQMVGVLDILNDYLSYRGIKYERIDGGIRGTDRQQAIDRFSKKNSDSNVFLLCTRAGGTGINLTAADTVIIFDSDPNPQNDLQAQARCHRIGQDKKVKIYRLITRNTYERTMFDRASLKLGLDHAILNQVEDENAKSAKEGEKQKKSLTHQEVVSLLKKGAYNIFKEDDDKASKAFCEENIEQILSRRATTIVLGSSGSSTFSTASFASEATRPELDVNDPNFWRKLMPDQAKSYDAMNMDEPSRKNEDDIDDDTLEKRGPWTSTIRNKFQKALMLFGYGRWTKLKQYTKIKLETRLVIKYAEAYLDKVCTILNINCADFIAQITNPDTEDYPSLAPIVNEPSEVKQNEEVVDYQSDPGLTDPSFLVRLQKISSNMEQRLIMMFTLGEIIRLGLKEFGDKWPEMEGDCPKWWGQQEDRDLLIGIHKHGFGKYDQIRADPTLCFVKEVKPDKKKRRGKAAKEESELNEWPGAKWLTLRFKQSIRACADFRRKLVRRAAREEKKKAKAEEKEKKKKEKERERKRQSTKKVPKPKMRTEWSKREMGDFYKIVTTHGIPWNQQTQKFDFEFVKVNAKLTQKEIPSIEKYYTLFLSTCRKIIEHKDNPELVKDDLLLSAVQAKRALERVAMFNALRRQVLALPEKEMEQLLTGPLSLPSVLKRSHLPDWWEPYKHDMGLVRGIDKFGFGKWEEVFTEPSFNLIVEKKKAEFGEGAGSLNGVLALPQDKVFMKRINYIIKIASGGKSLEKAPSIAELEEKHTDEEIEDFIDEEEDQEAKVGSKRKRGKAKPTSLPAPKRRKSNEIRRDPTGKVIFPIELGVLTIDSLGTISLKKSFHTEKYIWPVGYRSRREYTSSVDINKRCEYICEIQDVDDKPVFVVTDPDDLQNSVHANSASSAWKQILDRINLKKSAEVKRNSVSGPEYFGFGVPLIADLISKLPNADQCARFGHKKERKRTPSQILAHKEPVQETGEERPGPVPLHPTLDPEEIPVTAEPVNIAEYQQAIENSTNEHFVPTILYRPGTLPQIKTFNQLGTVNVPVIDANIEVATPIRNGPLPRYAGNHPQMAVLPQIYYGEHLQSHHTYHPQHPKT